MAQDTGHTLEFWRNYWANGLSPWHLNEANRALVGFASQAFEGPAKILVPLCGKSLDLKWLYDCGHHVVGIEFAEEAILQFFTEQSMDYTSSPFGENGTLYQNSDKRLTLIRHNFFTLNDPSLNGTFDYVWDRASLIAVKPEHRVLYSETIKRMVRPQFRYMIQVLEYDQDKVMGPPFSITLQDMDQLYGDFASISNLVSSSEDIREKYIPDKFNGIQVKEMLYLLTPKQSTVN
jgi:thiopurine S-methyltransferase